MRKTALYDKHVALGAKIVPFAGFEMLEDTDTPGRADPYYLVEQAEQFVGVDIEVDGYPIDAVSQSTITHNAIMDSALNIARFFVEEVLGQGFNRPAPTVVDQAVLELAKTQQDKAAVVLNMAKWEAAGAWCRNQGIKFRVINESDIFVNAKRK